MTTIPTPNGRHAWNENPRTLPFGLAATVLVAAVFVLSGALGALALEPNSAVHSSGGSVAQMSTCPGCGAGGTGGGSGTGSSGDCSSSHGCATGIVLVTAPLAGGDVDNALLVQFEYKYDGNDFVAWACGETDSSGQYNIPLPETPISDGIVGGDGRDYMVVIDVNYGGGATGWCSQVGSVYSNIWSEQYYSNSYTEQDILLNAYIVDQYTTSVAYFDAPNDGGISLASGSTVSTQSSVTLLGVTWTQNSQQTTTSVMNSYDFAGGDPSTCTTTGQSGNNPGTCMLDPTLEDEVVGSSAYYSDVGVVDILTTKILWSSPGPAFGPGNLIDPYSYENQPTYGYVLFGGPGAVGGSYCYPPGASGSWSYSNTDQMNTGAALSLTASIDFDGIGTSVDLLGWGSSTGPGSSLSTTVSMSNPAPAGGHSLAFEGFQEEDYHDGVEYDGPIHVWVWSTPSSCPG